MKSIGATECMKVNVLCAMTNVHIKDEMGKATQTFIELVEMILKWVSGNANNILPVAL